MDTLPPTRNVKLIITEVNVTGPCCTCRVQDGVLRCSRCKAVSYCSQDCQKKGWKDHKKTCNAINQKFQETTAAINELADHYGDTAASLEAELVNDGQFRFNAFGWNSEAEYVQDRLRLAEAYAKCGQETFSRQAFRLAVENFLDILCLTHNDQFTDFNLLKGCSWMVAGGMDQLALNFLCYVTRRGQAPRPFRYLDLSIDEDIEGASCITVVQEINECFQTFMLISLIKIKRLQALLVQGRKEDAGWNAFMEGTHPGTGASSEVLRLGGVDLVTEKLKEFVLDQSTNRRVDLLAKQINGLLETVNERNSKLIPGVIDRQTLEEPTFPDWVEAEEWNDEKYDRYTTEGEERDIHSARYAVDIYGHAWHMDKEYTRSLRLFLDTGNVMAEEVTSL